MDTRYEQIIARLDDYLLSISMLSNKTPESIAHTRSFLTDNYTTRLGDIPLELTREAMLGMLAEESVTQWTTHVKAVYWIIDVTQPAAAGYLTEELRHPESGELLRLVNLLTHMQLQIDGDDIRICREHMVEAPAKFRSDTLPGRATS